MLINTRGIVLRMVKYSETSIITDIYTEARGMQSYYIPGVRSEKSRMKPGLFQAMSVVDLVATAREDKAMQGVREARMAEVYETIPFDVRKGAIALFLAEVIRKTLREVEANPALFTFLLENLLFLDRSPRFSNVHLHFLVHFSGFLGFLPGGDYQEDTPCFNLREGMFTGAQDPEPRLLSPELSEVLYQLLELDIQAAQQIAMGKSARNTLLDYLLEYYRFHLDYLPDIQAHLILQETFNL